MMMYSGEQGMTSQESRDAESGWLTAHNRHTGEGLKMRRLRRNGEIWLELKGTLPPNRGGAPLHVHFENDEEGTVMTGTLGAVVDGVDVRVEKGGLVRLPKGSRHRWWNVGADTLQFDGFARPAADLDRFLAAIFDVLNSGAAERPPLFYMAHLLWRHRRTQMVAIGPRSIQLVLFPTLVLIGTLLGKYRGTDWPGCPARFPEAPLVS